MHSLNFRSSLERNVPPSHSSIHLILEVLGVGGRGTEQRPGDKKHLVEKREKVPTPSEQTAAHPLLGPRHWRAEKS